MASIDQPGKLTHLGTDQNTAKNGSPGFYATDDGRYVIQGYKLTGDARRDLVHFPPDREDAVIVTPALIDMIAAHHAETT